MTYYYYYRILGRFICLKICYINTSLWVGTSYCFSYWQQPEKVTHNVRIYIYYYELADVPPPRDRAHPADIKQTKTDSEQTR